MLFVAINSQHEVIKIKPATGGQKDGIARRKLKLDKVSRGVGCYRVLCGGRK